MKRQQACVLVFALATIALATIALGPHPAGAQAPGPYYARGTYFCSTSLSGTGSPTDSCFGYGPEVQLFDDGAHNDGAAGDGVFGADVATNQGPGFLEFKIANADWTFAEPTAGSAPLVNGRIWTQSPGEIVHFRLDFSTPTYGWVPAVAVANDHGYPAGTTLELMGSAPELGSWGVGLPADKFGSIWQKIVTIATPGTYEYKFRVLGSWLWSNFGPNYNNNFGSNGVFTTTDPNTEMIIQFDELTGRVRAIDNHSVAARTTSWGRLKTMYR
jgi:hypothetical protein